MKNILFFLFFSSLYLLSHSQQNNLDKAKKYLKRESYEKAISSIEEAAIHPETKTKAETWYIKGLIYLSASYKDEFKENLLDYIDSAHSSILKSYNIDSTEYEKFMLLYNSGVNQLLSVYGLYFKIGAESYNKEDYNSSLKYFTKAYETKEQGKKMPNFILPDLDTSLVINIAITAENLLAKTKGNKDKEKEYQAISAEYYSKIADAKITGEKYAGIYKWLAFYYYQTNPDTKKLAYYINLGKTLYPKDPYYIRLEIDIERKKNNPDKHNLFNLYAKILENKPNDIEVLKAYASDLFSYIHPSDRNMPKPKDYQENGKKLDKIYEKLIQIDNKKLIENILDLGKHKYNQFIYALNKEYKDTKQTIKTQQQNIKKEMKKYVGSKSKVNINKRKKLESEYDMLNTEIKNAKAKIVDPYLEEAILNLEKVFNHFDNMKAKLSPIQKSYYKAAIDLLINCYSEKGNKEKITFYENKYDAANRK